MGLLKFLKTLKPLSDNDKYCLGQLKEFEEFDEIRKLVKTDEAKFELRTFNLSMFEGGDYFQIVSKNPELKGLIDKVNEKLKKSGEEEIFKRVGASVFEVLPRYIAPNIFGMEHIKKAVALQLFSNERVHILLLGDVGTGKTDILRSGAEFSPISCFGLGSGTSAAGLSVAFSGNKAEKGLLALADNGICAIDELNLMKKIDRAALFNAMEKGFITADKAGQHLNFDTRIRILATANPTMGKFDRTFEKIKRQIPFDSALLQRFHLIFFVRTPDVTTFRKITKSIVEDKKVKVKDEDKEFIRDYISYASNIEVSLPKEFEDEITEFIEEIKRKEFKYLVEISPRLIIGLIRLAKASSRSELRDKVERKDLERAEEILKESLRVI